MTSIPVCGHIHGLDALSQERREVTIKAAPNEVIIELEIPDRKDDGPPSIILQWTLGEGWCVLIYDGLEKVARHKIADRTTAEEMTD